MKEIKEKEDRYIKTRMQKENTNKSSKKYKN